LYQYLNVMGGA